MLGTSIESDRYTFRADHLRAAPAAARFLSLEPLLGPVLSLNLDGIDWVIVGGESGPDARPMHPDWVRDVRDRCVAAGVPFLLKQWGEWAPRSDAAGRRRPTGLSDRTLDRTAGGFVLAEPRSDTERFGAFTVPGADSAPWFMDRVGRVAAGRALDGRCWDETPELWGPVGAGSR